MRTFGVLLLSTAVLLAADHPSLSGVWKLDAAASDFGPTKPPKSAVNTISHDEPVIQVSSKVENDRGTSSTAYQMFTDGREFHHEPMGMKATIKARWEGEELVSETVIETPSGAVNIADRWKLSPDQATLTINRKVAGPQGGGTQRYVYQRKK